MDHGLSLSPLKSETYRFHVHVFCGTGDLVMYQDFKGDSVNKCRWLFLLFIHKILTFANTSTFQIPTVLCGFEQV